VLVGSRVESSVLHVLNVEMGIFYFNVSNSLQLSLAIECIDRQIIIMVKVCLRIFKCPIDKFRLVRGQLFC